MIANQIHSEQEGKEIYEKINVVANKFLNIDLQYLGGIKKDSYMSKAIIQQLRVTKSNASKPFIARSATHNLSSLFIISEISLQRVL